MIVATITLVLVIVGMFVFAYLKKAELNETTIPQPTTETNDTSPYAHIIRIDAKHFFIDGEHTLVGEILMPTPCDLLNWTTSIAESMPEQVTLNFDVVNHSETCAEVVTAQRFKVSFRASEQAVIKATLEGRIIDVNLIPALPNESPDDFELFIKG
jgi:hypothetical protein